jgi:uncharacterized Rmd1/YagE family protein
MSSSPVQSTHTAHTAQHLSPSSLPVHPVKSYTLAQRFNLRELDLSGLPGATVSKEAPQNPFVVVTWNGQQNKETVDKPGHFSSQGTDTENNTVSLNDIKPKIARVQTTPSNATVAGIANVQQTDATKDSIDKHHTSTYTQKTKNQVTSGRNTSSVGIAPRPVAVIFAEGTIVAWNVTSAQTMQKLMNACSLTTQNRFTAIETETLDFVQPISSSRIMRNSPAQTTAEIQKDLIILPDPAYTSEQDILLAQVALSSGLARSTRLGVIESELDAFLSKLTPITDELVSGRKPTFSREHLVSILGKLLQFRGTLNLHSELTEIPDRYWSAPSLEKLYVQVSMSLDVTQRITMINRKLDYANEIVAKLHELSHSSYDLKLEWSIIILISIEVAFGIHDIWFMHAHEK